MPPHRFDFVHTRWSTWCRLASGRTGCAASCGRWWRRPVPDSFWRAFLLTDHPTLSTFLGRLVGPVIPMLSFVCSVGNVPLAAVLWHGGISFGGVISFIFADLLILPILNVYRRYYGGG